MTQTGIMPLLLRRRKRTLVLSGAATAILAFGLAKIMPQSYYSEGSLIIENRPSIAEGQAAPSAISNVTTQVAVLQSKGLAEAVVKRLDLTHLSTLKAASRLPFNLADWITVAKAKVNELRRYIDNGPPPVHTELDKTVVYVQQHLKVSNAEDSSVIAVGFEAGSPATAALVANVVMQTYLNTIDKVRQAQTSQTNEWLESQLSLRRHDLAQAEAKLNRFVQTHDLAQVQNSSTSALQLSEDQDELIKAEETLAEKQAAFNAVVHGGGATAPIVLNSYTIRDYRTLEASVLGKLSVLGPNDPRRIPLEENLRSVQRQINRQTEEIVASMRHEVAIAQAHVNALRQAVTAGTSVAQTSAVNDATYRQLSSDLEAKRNLYVAFMTQVGQARAATEQAPTAHVLFSALAPEQPLHEFGMISLLIGFMAGAAGAAGVITLRNSMGLKISNAIDMSEITGLRAYGSLPEARGRNLLESGKSRAMVTETLRGIWVTMREGGQAILVTSSEIGEGKSTVATTMARRFAEDGLRVLLIDADLRRPTMHKVFSIQPIDLESVLKGETKLEKALHQVGDCLYCLAVKPVSNPPRLLSSGYFSEFIAGCRTRFDFLIIDSPPVLHVVDPVLLAKVCQQIIFVIQSELLSQEIVNEAISRFSPEDRSKMASLVTRVRYNKLDSRNYYSGYDMRGRL